MLRAACSLFWALLLASAAQATSFCEEGAPVATVTPGTPVPSSSPVGLELCLAGNVLLRATQVSIEEDEILIGVFGRWSTALASLPPVSYGVELGLLASGTYDFTVSLALTWPTIDGPVEAPPFVAAEGTFTVAPEPRTAALACLGLALLAIGGRDRRKDTLPG